jgi:exodeoxyribonuclease V alpha subunit
MAPINKESSADKLARLLAKAKEMKAAQEALKQSNPQLTEVAAASIIATTPTSELVKLASSSTELNNLVNNHELAQSKDKSGNSITYNEQQLRFIDVASKGESAILIGAAGTGKTTTMRGTMEGLIQSGRAGVLHADGHKYLSSGTPGIVVVSFTRRAVANIRKAISDDMKGNCLTIHALLEYEPEYYEIIDPETGDSKTSMRFIATRNAMRPLPPSIRVCVIEESSMVSVDYFKQLKEALPHEVQFIFLGDIQQLPPVFGAAILGYKMLELPTIELTQVYRQALESPIIRLAHRILSGKPIPVTEYTEWKEEGKLTIHPWKKKLDADNAVMTIAKFLTTANDNGLYNPDEDMVLIPFNKACGTIELNKRIAQHMARKRKAVVHEIVAGFNKLYLSVGDKVLYDKEDAIVTEINLNGNYSGAGFQPASITMDYWGFDSGSEDSSAEHHVDDEDDDDIDFLLSQSVALGDGEERVRQASHVVTVKLMDTGSEIKLDTAADLNNLLLSFALTVHKSQGSEYRKVFLTLHQSHATMIQRELLYTACTRAKEELYIICEPEHFTKGILSQRIKGNTLAEKAEFFKGKPLAKGETL